MNAIWHDSVVAEIHAVRERLAEQYHGDMAAYTAAAEAHCRELGLNMANEKIRKNPELPTQQTMQE
jgi:hypothetical protein